MHWVGEGENRKDSLVGKEKGRNGAMELSNGVD